MSSQKAAVSTPYKLRTQVSDRGNVFFGYTRARSIALPRHLSEHDRGLRSAFRKELRSQWLEPVFRKKYLRYFCGSCRFQWTVWWCHPERFLVWSARGSADWEVAAVCRGINRAVHARENGLAAANSATSFAEALGRGSRFPTTKAARLTKSRQGRPTLSGATFAWLPAWPCDSRCPFIPPCGESTGLGIDERGPGIGKIVQFCFKDAISISRVATGRSCMNRTEGCKY